MDCSGEGASAERDNVVASLLKLQGREEFKALLEEQPRLLQDEAVAEVLELQDLPGYGTVLKALGRLLSVAREDPDAAWSEYESALAASQAGASELVGEVREAARALEAGASAGAIAIIDRALARADSIGDGPVSGLLYGLRGRATLELDGDRAEAQESALHEFVIAASLSSGDAQAAAMIDIAAVSLDRVREDRAENLEHGLALMRLVLRELSKTASSGIRLRARRTLIKALLNQERGDRVAQLREAEELSREELADSVEDAWASGQLNLGAALEALAGLGEVDRREAEAAYRAILANEDQVSEESQLGLAHLSIGRLLRRSTDLSAEDEYLEEAEVPLYVGVDGVDNRPILNDARVHLEEACERLSRDSNRLDFGKALDELAEVLLRLEETDRAIEVNREALAILRPTFDPTASRSAARRLAMALAKREDWAGSADAFRDAVEAAELLYHRRLDPRMRNWEIWESISLARWAAFAVAASGDVAGAALMLESSRARQLRRRVGPEVSTDPDHSIPQELRLAHDDALAALRSAPLGGEGSQAAWDLHNVLAQIRRADGSADFGRGAQPKDFDGAAAPGWPLVYINPTPFGTQLLFVTYDDEETQFESTSPPPTSWEVLKRLLIGKLAEAELDAQMQTPIDASYMAGIQIVDEESAFDLATLERRIEQLRNGLDDLLPWFGEKVGKPLAKALSSMGAKGATLVPCGVIALAPLHAVQWIDGTRNTALLDDFILSYAPSALLAAESGRRAARAAPSSPHLTAVANPNEDLPAAVPEVEAVASHFAGNVAVAIGPNADSDFLERNLKGADYVHLACHAQAALDPARTGVVLSDDLLPAAEFGRRELSARLVAVSACQGAITDTVANPEEFFSIGTAILAAGATCVIASLWPVDDRATAFLMIRLYDELMVGDLLPPAALRQAQLWLRELSDRDVAGFLAQHSSLDAALRRLGDAGVRRSLGGGKLQSASRPFSHPDFWAGFVAIGS
jgi:CHAT domain-containing protein/tetratricopeptide (TPR) repeat protein